MFSSYSLNRVIVLFIAAGFLFFAVDSFVEHRDVLTKELASIIPVAYAVFGVIAAMFAALRWNASAIRALRLYLIAGILIAAGGLYFHLAEEDDDEKQARTEEQFEQQTAPGQQESEREKDKPPLAPLAFAGIGSLGLIATAKRWTPETPTAQSPQSPS